MLLKLFIFTKKDFAATYKEKKDIFCGKKNLAFIDSEFVKICQKHNSVSTLHRGSSSICWVLVRDLDRDLHLFGVIGFLWMKSNSYDGP